MSDIVRVELTPEEAESVVQAIVYAVKLHAQDRERLAPGNEDLLTRGWLVWPAMAKILRGLGNPLNGATHFAPAPDSDRPYAFGDEG